MLSSDGKYYKTDVAATKEISKEKNPITIKDSQTIARQGGTIAGNTRKEIEE
jgi:hypothetical protein